MLFLINYSKYSSNVFIFYSKPKDTSLYQRVIHYSKLGQPLQQQKRLKT